jgi:hypothetical protein
MTAITWAILALYAAFTVAAVLLLASSYLKRGDDQ